MGHRYTVPENPLNKQGECGREFTNLMCYRGLKKPVNCSSIAEFSNMKRIVLICLSLWALQTTGFSQTGVEIVIDPSVKPENKEPKKAPPVVNEPKPPTPVASAVVAGKWYPFSFQGDWGFRNENDGVEIEPTLRASLAFPFYKNFACLRGTDKYSVINGAGKITSSLPEGFYPATWPLNFIDGFLLITNRAGKCNLMDGKGKLISTTNFDYAENFYKEMAVVKEGVNCYYINKQGKKVLGPYADARRFGNGLAPIKKMGATKWVYINSEGVIKIYEEFADADYFQYELAPVKKADGKWNYINPEGKAVGNKTYIDAEPFVGLYARVQNENKTFSFLSATTTVVTLYVSPYTSEFKYCSAYSGGVYFIESQEGKHYLMDSLGIIYSSNNYYDYCCFGGYYSGGKKYNGKWTFLNIYGTSPLEKLEFDALDIWGFVNGYAKVKKDGKWGMIDIAGNVVVDFQYNEIESIPQIE